MWRPVLMCLAVCWSALLGGSAASPPCSLPPSRWCSSLASAARCGVLKECLASDLYRRRERADPVQVTLYYESLCPGCRLFLTKMLLPTWVMLQDIMTVSLVPYGNAEESHDGQKYTYKCQHGEAECLGNMIEACVLNMTSKAFSIIYCMESSHDVIKAGENCVGLYDPNLKWDKVMSCVKGDMGNQLMHQNAMKTKALQPPHNYVPWVTINEKHTEELQDEAMNRLFALVCRLYEGPPIAACGKRESRFLSYCQKD